MQFNSDSLLKNHQDFPADAMDFILSAAGFPEFLEFPVESSASVVLEE